MGGDIDWGTVERQDGPLLTDTASQEPEVLEVPALTGDVIEEIERESSSQETSWTDTEPDNWPGSAQRGEPGSTVECDECGKQVRVKRDGFLSKHKCEPKPQRGNRFMHLPERRSTTPRKVREFAITTIAWGVEESAAHALARPFGADPDDVPTELPDAEGMIGPPLDMLWPSIPDSAQKFISACADNSDLIACALAWGDWMRTLSKWTRDMRAYSQSLAEQERQNGPTQFAGTDGVGRVVPFSPS